MVVILSLILVGRGTAHQDYRGEHKRYNHLPHKSILHVVECVGIICTFPKLLLEDVPLYADESEFAQAIPQEF